MNSKHTEEEFDHTFGANKQVVKSSYRGASREPTFEMKGSEPRSEAGRSVHIPAELDFHLSTCCGDKREAFSRCGAPWVEEGFAVAGIKNASSVRRVTFPRAEPAVDEKEPV